MNSIKQEDTIEGLVRLKSGVPIRADVHATLEKRGLVEFKPNGQVGLTQEGEREVYWPDRTLYPAGMRDKLMSTTKALGNADNVNALIDEKCVETGEPRERATIFAALEFIGAIRKQLNIGREVPRIRRMSSVAAEITKPRNVTESILRTLPNPSPSMG